MFMINKFKYYFLKKKNPIKYWRDKGAVIGEHCEIYSSSNFGSEPYLINIGNHVRINSGVQFVTHDGGVWVFRNQPQIERSSEIDLFGKISVGNNVHIGTNAIIMPGVKIGDNCVIGCGAIVTKDIPDNSIAVGIPAKVIETIDEYYCKHKQEFLYTKEMPDKEKRGYLINYFNNN